MLLLEKTFFCYCFESPGVVFSVLREVDCKLSLKNVLSEICVCSYHCISISPFFSFRVYPSEKMKIGDNFCWKYYYYYKSTTILSTLEYSFSIIGQSPTRLNSVFSAVLMDLDAFKNICEINQVDAPNYNSPKKQVDNDCYLYHFINMHSTSKKYTTLIMILFKN